MCFSSSAVQIQLSVTSTRDADGSGERLVNGVWGSARPNYSDRLCIVFAGLLLNCKCSITRRRRGEGVLRIPELRSIALVVVPRARERSKWSHQPPDGNNALGTREEQRAGEQRRRTEREEEDGGEA